MASSAHTESVTKTLLSFQRSSHFCDTAIIAKDRMVFVHGCVLAAVCPNLFSALNQNPFTSFHPNVIDLAQHNSSLIQRMIEFFYTGRAEVDVLPELCGVCEQLGVTLQVSDGTVSIAGMTKPESNEYDRHNGDWSETYVVEETTQDDTSLAIEDVRFLRELTSADGPALDNNVHRFTTDNDRRSQRKTAQRADADGDGDGEEAQKQIRKRSDVADPVDGGQSTERLFEPVKDSEIKTEFVEVKLEVLEEECIDSTTTEDVAIAVKRRGRRKKGDAGGEGPKPATSSVVPFECTLCGKSFRALKTLTTHTYEHSRTESGKYQCVLCGKVFDSTEGLRRHTKRHTRAFIKKPHVCSVCGHAWKSPGRLSAHMNTHTGVKPYACTDCGKRFGDKDNLSRHRGVHRSEQPYLCSDCGSSFRLRKTYVEHVMTHTGEKPHPCRVCDARFSQSYSLTIHMRTHTRERPYQCDRCSKTFTMNQRLVTHVLTAHTANDDKPQKCSECDKRFATRYRLKQHMDVHTRPHACLYCAKRFSCKYKAKCHLQKCKKRV